MRQALARVSATPAGWSVCRANGRRRPVVCWAVFENREVVGMVAAGATLIRGDRFAGFRGYAAGVGCEPVMTAPELPAADLQSLMFEALEPDADDWETYEHRIRAALESAAFVEWASDALAGFGEDPRRWFKRWIRLAREHEDAEKDLWARLRPISLLAPGASLEEALAVAGTTLGGLLAAPDPPSTTSARPATRRAQQGDAL